MQISVDIEAPDPLFVQLINQIKTAVLGDQLNPGDPLPSIRQLANDLNLNSKTVAKAYKLLERDEVIQSKGYRGTYIHPDAKENCTVDVTEMIEHELARTIEALRLEGATDSEIRIAFNQLMNSR